MVFKVKNRIILSAVLTEFCSFRVMIKTNLSKKNILGSALLRREPGFLPKIAKLEGKSHFIDKSE